VLSFALLLVWGVTATYFAFPEPFEGTIDLFDDDLNDLERPGEGLGVRTLWTVLGLVPAVLFFTGFVLWWTRVVRRRAD
jgi:hypothetical protein